MKSATLLTLILFYCFLCSAQSNQQIVFDLKNVEHEEKISIPFSAIKVIDARYDQSNIGCFTADFTRAFKKEKKLEAVFPDSLKTYLPLAIEKVARLDKNNDDTLVLLVKRFRLAERFEDEIANAFRPELYLNISLSFYELKGDDYHKISSIDDTKAKMIGLEYEVVKKNIENLRRKAFLNILSDLFLNKRWQPSSIAFHLTDIQQGLNKRFDLPVLHDTFLVPGLYKTFEEFKNNRPSVINIKIISKKDNLRAVESSNDTTLNLNDYWGACDGNQKFIVFRSNLWPLIKSDNGFKFESFRSTMDVNKGTSYGNYATNYGALLGAAAKLAEDQKRSEFFYVNMENGEIHFEELFGRSKLTSFQKDLLK
ncbi:MAG TPA: hypothetical protein VNS32_05720 [Flavisolibacter sp.]|nr:hypothetical protein [Flavisolibacter sp.]